MRRPGGNFIQPDSRGRIQLPKELRKFLLFELSESSGGYLLAPLETQKATISTARVKDIWLNEDVTSFIHREFKPRACDLMKYHAKELNISSLVLYGSRARGDALTSSDFDFAIFCSGRLSFDRRHEIRELFESHFSDLFAVLKTHQVSGELSLSFIPSTVAAGDWPSLYYSVATDGVLLWQASRGWFDVWKRKVLEEMKKRGVKRQSGFGKSKVWIWKAGGPH